MGFTEKIRKFLRELIEVYKLELDFDEEYYEHKIFKLIEETLEQL